MEVADFETVQPKRKHVSTMADVTASSIRDSVVLSKDKSSNCETRDSEKEERSIELSEARAPEIT